VTLVVIVELRMLPGEVGAATKFLQSKLQGLFKIAGNRIEIEDQVGQDVKVARSQVSSSRKTDRL